MVDNNIYSETIDKRLFICFVFWFIAMGGALAGFNSHSLRLNGLNEVILPFILIYLITITELNGCWKL